MPGEAYETDFKSARSRSEFRALLETADRVVEAPLLSAGRAWRSRSEARNHQYAWASAYVAKNSDVLFALWDGEPARGTGGTAYVVDWFLAGRTPRRYAMSRARLRRGKSAHARKLIHVNTRTSVVRRRRAAYFQYAEWTTSSQMLCRPRAGRHEACFSERPRIDPRRFVPCHDRWS